DLEVLQLPAAGGAGGAGEGSLFGSVRTTALQLQHGLDRCSGIAVQREYIALATLDRDVPGHIRRRADRHGRQGQAKGVAGSTALELVRGSIEGPVGPRGCVCDTNVCDLLAAEAGIEDQILARVDDQLVGSDGAGADDRAVQSADGDLARVHGANDLVAQFALLPVIPVPLPLGDDLGARAALEPSVTHDLDRKSTRLNSSHVTIS